jgi:hypothetical protein
MHNVFFCPSLISKKLSFNRPALSKVTTTAAAATTITKTTTYKCDHTTIICKRGEKLLPVIFWPFEMK